MNEVEEYRLVSQKLEEEHNFYHEFWKHYIALEQKFVETDKFVSIDSENYGTFSIEFEFLLGAICNEINVVMQRLVREYDQNYKCNTIKDFLKFMFRIKDPFNLKLVNLELYNLDFFPWGEVETNKNNEITNYPTWWNAYNDLKHHRITRKMIDGKITVINNFKKANLKNVLTALSALYLLEMKCIDKIREKYTNIFEKENIDDEYLTYPEKSIFSISLQPEECIAPDSNKTEATTIF